MKSVTRQHNKCGGREAVNRVGIGAHFSPVVTKEGGGVSPVISPTALIVPPRPTTGAPEAWPPPPGLPPLVTGLRGAHQTVRQWGADGYGVWWWRYYYLFQGMGMWFDVDRDRARVTVRRDRKGRLWSDRPFCFRCGPAVPYVALPRATLAIIAVKYRIYLYSIVKLRKCRLRSTRSLSEDTIRWLGGVFGSHVVRFRNGPMGWSQ